MTTQSHTCKDPVAVGGCYLKKTWWDHKSLPTLWIKAMSFWNLKNSEHFKILLQELLQIYHLAAVHHCLNWVKAKLAALLSRQEERMQVSRLWDSAQGDKGLSAPEGTLRAVCITSAHPLQAAWHGSGSGALSPSHRWHFIQWRRELANFTWSHPLTSTLQIPHCFRSTPKCLNSIYSHSTTWQKPHCSALVKQDNNFYCG